MSVTVTMCFTFYDPNTIFELKEIANNINKIYYIYYTYYKQNKLKTTTIIILMNHGTME